MIDTSEKIRLLKKLSEKSSTASVENCDDPNFKTWKNLVERTFIKIFGKDSTELEHFSDLSFFYFAGVSFSDSDYTGINRMNNIIV